MDAALVESVPSAAAGASEGRGREQLVWSRPNCTGCARDPSPERPRSRHLKRMQ